jgi:hypothetical protein
VSDNAAREETDLFFRAAELIAHQTVARALTQDRFACRPSVDCRPIRQESIMENQIVVESPDGTFRAYIARPVKLPVPAVVVLQELFLTPTSERPAMSWQPKGLSRSRQTYSGGKNLVSIST